MLLWTATGLFGKTCSKVSVSEKKKKPQNPIFAKLELAFTHTYTKSLRFSPCIPSHTILNPHIPSIFSISPLSFLPLFLSACFPLVFHPIFYSSLVTFLFFYIYLFSNTFSLVHTLYSRPSKRLISRSSIRLHPEHCWTILHITTTTYLI